MALRTAIPVAAAVLLAATASATVPVVELPEILLSRQLAEARGLVAGDVVRLGPHPSGENAAAFRVAGLYEPVPDPFRLTALRFEARMHLPELIALVADADPPAEPESVTRVNVLLKEPEDARAFAADLAARMPGLVAVPTNGSVDETDPFVVLERFHVAIASVTVLGSAAFLLALMVMRAEERREAAGILRLIGLTRPRILLGVFCEGLFIAATGVLFGLLLAVVLQGLFNRFFQWHYDTALVFVRVTPGIAAKCVAIAVPLGIVSGVIASWTLLRRNIMGLLKR